LPRAKFYENQLKIAAVGAMTDALTDRQRQYVCDDDDDDDDDVVQRRTTSGHVNMLYNLLHSKPTTTQSGV